jgi:hypothetical protein
MEGMEGKFNGNYLRLIKELFLEGRMTAMTTSVVSKELLIKAKIWVRLDLYRIVFKIDLLFKN